MGYDRRVHGKGPVAYRFGKYLKLAVSDVRAWMAEQWNAFERSRPTDWR